MLKFIHCADLHLNRLFKNVSISNSSVLDALTASTQRAWNQIIDTAIQQQVDFVAICGDIFDSESPDIATQLKFLESLKRLNEHHIQAFIITGNHDPLSSWSKSLVFPENTTIFDSKIAECIKIFDTQKQHIANVLGFSFKNKQQPTSVVQKFYNYIEKNNLVERNVPNIGLLHCEIVGVNNSAELTTNIYAPTTISELNNKKFIDYWALGHVHQRQEVLNEDYKQNSLILYPGIMQGRSINDVGDKGCWLVSCDNEKFKNNSALDAWDVQFLPTSSLNYYSLHIEIQQNHLDNEFELKDYEKNLEFICDFLLNFICKKIQKIVENRSQASIAQTYILRCIIEGRVDKNWCEFINDFGNEILERINEEFVNEKVMGIECYLEKIVLNTKAIYNYENLKNSSPFFTELNNFFYDMNNELFKLEGDEKVRYFLGNEKLLNMNINLKKRALELLDDEDVKQIIDLGLSDSFNYTLDEED